MFNFCDQKSQQGSRSFEHAVVESLPIVVICYHNNYSSDCVFPYFPIERVDTSRQSLVTYWATDSPRLGRSCKRAFKVLLKIIVNHYLFSRTGKINNHFFQEKKLKNVNLLQPIYISKNIYKNTSIYRTPIYRYKYSDISNAIYRYFWYIVANPTQI